MNPRIERYRQFAPAGQRYVEALLDLLAQDADGYLTDLLRRHMAGERVADEYLDPDTGERVRIAEGEPVPEGCLPVFDAMQG